MHQQKVISKNVADIYTFYAFTHVRQTCFAYNFLLVHFLTIFSTDSKSAFFSIFFDFFQKKIFCHIALFKTLKANALKTAQKIKKLIL